MFAELDRLLLLALMLCEEGRPFVPGLLVGLPQKDLRSGDDWPDLLANSVGVGGVFTITGAGLSPFGGVRGGIFVSTLGWTLARFSGEASLAVAGGSRTGKFWSDSGSTDMVGCCSSRVSTGGWGSLPGRRSGLELFPEVLLGLKMSFNLPAGEGERRAEVWGGTKPVLLRLTRRSFDSTESDRVGGNVDDFEVLLLES
jgi:hypothetical protein